MRSTIFNSSVLRMTHSIFFQPHPHPHPPYERADSDTLVFCRQNLWSLDARGSKFCRLLWKHFLTDPVSESAFQRGWGIIKKMECPNTWLQISTPHYQRKTNNHLKTLPFALQVNWNIYFMIKRLSTYIVMEFHNKDPLFYIYFQLPEEYFLSGIFTAGIRVFRQQKDSFAGLCIHCHQKSIPLWQGWWLYWIWLGRGHVTLLRLFTWYKNMSANLVKLTNDI